MKSLFTAWGTDRKRIFRGISFSWIRFLLVLLIGVFQTPLLFKYLPAVELNTWYIFFSFGAFLQISDLGLVSSISRIIAYLDNTADPVSDEKIPATFRNFSMRQIYNTSLLSFSSILSLIGFALFIVYYFINRHNHLPDHLTIAFIIFLGGSVFSLLSNIPAAMLAGFRDPGYDSLLRSIIQILYFTSLFFLLPHFKSVIFVASLFFLQNFIQFLSLHFILYARHGHTLRNAGTGKRVELQVAKHIYKQSSPMLINQIGTWLTTQGTVFIALLVLGPNRLSDYAINQQLFNYGIAISLVINQTTGPFVAKQYIRGNRGLLIDYYKKITIACMGISCLFLSVMLPGCKQVISLWVGSSHFLGFHFALVFALIVFFEVQHSVAGNFVWYMGNWPFNKFTFAAGLLNIVLGYFLGKTYGLFGIALSTFISKFITLNWYVVWYCLRKLGITLKNYTVAVLLPMILSVLVPVVLVSYAQRYSLIWSFHQWGYLLMIVISSSMICGLLIWLFFRKSIGLAGLGLIK